MRYWHKADMGQCAANVRFRGESGHRLASGDPLGHSLVRCALVQQLLLANASKKFRDYGKYCTICQTSFRSTVRNGTICLQMESDSPLANWRDVHCYPLVTPCAR